MLPGRDFIHFSDFKNDARLSKIQRMFNFFPIFTHSPSPSVKIIIPLYLEEFSSKKFTGARKEVPPRPSILLKSKFLENFTGLEFFKFTSKKIKSMFSMIPRKKKFFMAR